MDPIKIAAVKGPDGVHLETYDVTELFEQAGAALSEKRYDDAIARLRPAAEGVPGHAATRRRPSTTRAWPTRGRRTGRRPSPGSRSWSTSTPTRSDAKDAQFQIGASYAEMGNWPTSATVFARDPRAQGPDRGRQDRGDGAARVRAVPAQGPGHRRADVLVGALLLQQHREGGAPGDRLLPRARASTTWGRSRTSASGPSRCACRRSRWRSTWRTRRACCWRRSASTSRPSSSGNPQWASASGYQVGSLYEEFYDAFIHAPIPPELLGEANQEKREVYYEELRKRIRILLEKSLRTHEQNLMMMERLGVQNEWRDKSKLAFAKLQKLLDPSYKFEFADPATAGSRHAGAAAPAAPRRRPRPTRAGAARRPSRRARPIRRSQGPDSARDRARPARFCSERSPRQARRG